MRARIGTFVACAVAASACGDSPTESTEYRVLGEVAATSHSTVVSDGVPKAWIVEGRRVKVEIATVGVCPVARTDWELTTSDIADGDFFGGHTLLFILPYEFRTTGCGDRSPDRGGRMSSTHVDTLDFEFGTALEATVRVVSRDGTVFDTWLDFHPGWPPEDEGAVARSR